MAAPTWQCIVLASGGLMYFLHPGYWAKWWAKPAIWGVLRLFWIMYMYIIYYINYVCAHHNAYVQKHLFATAVNHKTWSMASDEGLFTIEI